MEIVKYKRGETLKESCVLALGFFDGVHIGHRELLKMARHRASELNLSLGIFTFASSGKIKAGTKRIYNDEEKARIFEELGADFTVFADFDDVSGLSPEEFVRDVLIGDLHTSVAASGFNYRFGKGAAGDAQALARLMKKYGGDALILDEYLLDGKTVSTTAIREALEAGDVRGAARLLGAPYRIGGRVCHGRGEGKRLGFPTLNTSLAEGSIMPKRGVYLTAIKLSGRAYTALTNVGVCPTFDPREDHLETYILDYSGDLYDEEIAIYFLDYLRDEKQFSSEKELIMQINIDKNIALSKNISDLEI
ncbi:MAG: bifunctional riboflavin kinase/FAD synthetase [Clostridia bacterium]|nr:bifunctional riboflavin kinase/FAD synthetase [Clostridia bacterium]